MNTSNWPATRRALAEMTDEGLFEQLTTAVLRQAEPLYQSLVQTGINVAGRTIPAPLDGILFEKGAVPPHLVAVHHTTTARSKLGSKWLNEPSVDENSGVAGDLVKVARIAERERQDLPDLRVTLVLTTNQEPSEDLVANVHSEAHRHQIEVDLWSNSRIAHFLDIDPTGQYIRRQYLDNNPERLSEQLLHELAKTCLAANRPLDNVEAWIARTFDSRFDTRSQRGVLFVVGPSGVGKSVACFRALERHVEAGGFGMFLPANAVGSHPTLTGLVQEELERLYPGLTASEPSAFDLTGDQQPFVMVVEDINRCNSPRSVMEKLARWTQLDSSRKWLILCPVWPRPFAWLDWRTRRELERQVVPLGRFTEEEASKAVIARSKNDGRPVTHSEAAIMSAALGHDPLLIALHDFEEHPEPHYTIAAFVEQCCEEVARRNPDYSTADYWEALGRLGEFLLNERRHSPRWALVRKAIGPSSPLMPLLNHLVDSGRLIALNHSGKDALLAFRHDRVREWLLAHAALALYESDDLSREVIEDPLNAEAWGAALVQAQGSETLLGELAERNPLAMFFALRDYGSSATEERSRLTGAIKDWLDKPLAKSRANQHLRWEALTILSESDAPEVPDLARRFPDQTFHQWIAGLRHGDARSGVELCAQIEPSTRAAFRDQAIEHACSRHREGLVGQLEALFGSASLGTRERRGALRLAGYLREPRLAESIEAAWEADESPVDVLGDYIWALAHTCGHKARRFLKRPLDAWEALPDQSNQEGGSSPRDDLGAYELCWAFRQASPTSAIPYFIARARSDALRWPVTLMLEGVDDPEAVRFVVSEMASIQRRLEGTEAFSPFVLSAGDVWRRAQRDGDTGMSDQSRQVLGEIWFDRTNDSHLRHAAFRLWEASIRQRDIEILREVRHDDPLVDRALAARLKRCDKAAVARMLELVESEQSSYWWQFGRYVWTPELAQALRTAVHRRSSAGPGNWGDETRIDWILADLLTRQPTEFSGPVLEETWPGLRRNPLYVQAALYAGTPALVERVEEAVAECPEPAILFRHLDSRFGIKYLGHPGVKREEQILRLEPFLDFLDDMVIAHLWDACNEKGWIATRGELLDERLQPPHSQWLWDRESAIKDLDEFVESNRIYAIDHWIEGFVARHVDLEEILQTMIDWLLVRRSLKAFALVARALAVQGSRKDIDAIESLAEEIGDEAAEVARDLVFAIKRRTPLDA